MNLRFPEAELEQIAKRRVPSPREIGLIKKIDNTGRNVVSCY